LWAFIFTDLCMFEGYFATFFYERSRHPDAFTAGSGLVDANSGLFNTLCLVTSSLFVVLAVQSIRAGTPAPARRHLVVGGLLGMAFVVNKPFEWGHELADGHTPTQDIFFQLYFILTGLHLFHVLIGLFLLARLWKMTKAMEGRPTRRQERFAESSATFWHMVDLIWLVLFGLFYLVG
jgi:nitric oxide reductase NorE protein